MAGSTNDKSQSWEVKTLVRNFRTAWKFPRWRWALLIAVVSDALAFAVVLIPPAQWLLDAVTAAALLIALGFRWPLFVALGVEAVPALELFPAWALAVLALAGTTTQNSPDSKRGEALSLPSESLPGNRGSLRQSSGPSDVEKRQL
jgi:hypothetical protein